MHVIYVLKDPRTNEIRYVGYSCNAKQRFQHHLWDAENRRHNYYKDRWLRSLLKLGLKPVMTTIEIVTKRNWKSRERFHIARLKKTCRLTNLSAGGEGIDVPRTKIWAQRMVRTRKRNGSFVISQEAREKISRALIARYGDKCPNGHDFKGENLVMVLNKKNGRYYRECRICRNKAGRDFRRPFLKGNFYAQRTHCQLGHPLSGENLRWMLDKRTGKQIRICRICVRIRNIKAKRKMRARQYEYKNRR